MVRESLGGGVVYPLLGGGVSKANSQFYRKKRGYHGVFFFLPVSAVRSVGL